MILDIFLPERIGSYYVLPKRIIGLEITKHYIYATQIYIAGNQVIVEKCIDEFLDPNTQVPYDQKVIESLKKIHQSLDRYDEIRVSLNSSVVLFKELLLPFSEHDKIALVINYELEPLLPFPLHNAAIDFIITNKDIESPQANILVAVVQKNYILDQLRYFNDADIKLSAITVDMFDLYALYRTIPLYAKKKGDVVLIDLSLDTTKIAYIIDGQLKLIRTLPKGLIFIAKTVGSKRGISGKETLEKIIRFGLNNDTNQDHMDELRSSYNSFFSDIQFTLESFNTQLARPSKKDDVAILFLSEGAQINGVIDFAQEFLSLPCSLFDPYELIKSNIVTSKNAQKIPNSHTISLSTALSGIQYEQFNLLENDLKPSFSNKFIKQFFTSIALLLCIFIGLISHTVIQKNRLGKASINMEREVINSLGERDLTDAKSLNKAVEDAQEKVEKEEQLWFAFSRQTRFSFLKTLQDLSTSLDKKALGLSLKKLVITPNNVLIEGEVKGFPELKILERELRESQLFITVPPLQELKFNEKLFLKKNGDHQ